MKVVEFMGMPRAGKSTLIELMETILSYEKRLRVRCIYEGARTCPLGKNDRFQYNAWSFHNTINRLMETRQQELDYILIDRGVWDHIAFAYALYSNKRINKRQYEAQTKYFRTFSFLEDSVLAFMISPKISVEREQKYHRLQGKVTNMNFLSILHKAYSETIPNTKQYSIIDSTKTIEESKKEILKKLLYE